MGNICGKHLRKTSVENIWCVEAGEPSSRPVSDANSENPNPSLAIGSSSVKLDYNVIGRPAWLPAVKIDSCNNLLSSVHTARIIMRSVSMY